MWIFGDLFDDQVVVSKHNVNNIISSNRIISPWFRGEDELQRCETPTQMTSCCVGGTSLDIKNSRFRSKVDGCQRYQFPD